MDINQDASDVGGQVALDQMMSPSHAIAYPLIRVLLQLLLFMCLVCVCPLSQDDDEVIISSCTEDLAAFGLLILMLILCGSWFVG